MKAAAPRLLLAFALVLAANTRSQDPQSGQDTIFLRQGEAIAGRIAGFDGRTIRLQRFLPPLPGAPADAPVFASVTLQVSHIERIEFSSLEGADQKLRSATPANISEVKALWEDALIWLSVPKSRCAELGLCYANLLLAVGDFANAQKALEIFKLIETSSWDEKAKILARQGRLRAMIATGKTQEAILEAQQIAGTAADSAILIEAKFILAQAAHRAFDKFLADNPRWKEDAFAIPERNRLYDEVLELYLHPALFFGSEIHAASRGLWAVVEICKSAGDLKQALEASRDLLFIYPETSYARQAKAFIDSLPDILTKDNETEIAP
jgi:tetratricopeptide (TPR) repeat protein